MTIEADTGLFAYIYSRVRNWHDAEDLTQEVLIRAWMARATVREASRHDAWMYSIAHNLTVDFCLSAKARHEETPGELPDIPVNPIQEWERREELRDILSKINPHHCEVMLMKAEGYSFAEIARKQNIPASIAYDRHRSAKHQAACYLERKKLI